MATLGGIGGTAAILPITLIFWNFSVHAAVSHTTLFAFVSTLGRVIYEIMSTASKPKAKKINFHLIILIAPSMFLGSFLGVNLNKMSPNIFILTAMTLVLSFGVFKSTRKCLTKRKEEKDRERRAEELYHSIQYESQDFEIPSNIEGQQGEEEEEDQEEIVQQLVDRTDILMLCIICSLNPFLSILRGSKGMASPIGSSHCSATDLTIIFAYLLFVILITVINSRRILKKNKATKSSQKQIEFTPVTIVKMVIAFFLVGLVGSYLGSGLSILFTLALIFAGLSPFVASPTALLLTCMMAGSNAVLFALNNSLSPKASLYGSIIILVVSMAIRLTLYEVMMKQGKESIILSFIISIVLISIPANLIKVLPEIWEERTNGVDIFAFKGICY